MKEGVVSLHESLWEVDHSPMREMCENKKNTAKERSSLLLFKV